MICKRKVLKVGMLTSASALVFSVLASCSQSYYDYFAEVIVSSNTSVLADQSFSESSYDGWVKFMKEKGIDMPVANTVSQSTGIWRRPGNTTQDFITTYKGSFASGTDMLITPGFNHVTAIQSVVADSDYKNNGFLILDSQVNAPNVASFTFRAEESGFLSAIATCMFLSANYETFKKNGSTLKVGGFVGIPLPSTTDYLAGFQMGVFAYNEKMGTKTNASYHEVQWVNLGSNITSYSSGSFGVGDGTNKSRAILESGASAIIPIAGPQTTDAVSVISEKEMNAVVVGVDSAQEFQSVNQSMPHSPNIVDSNGTKISDPKIIQMSAIKDLETAVYKTSNAIFNKEDPNNANKTGDDVVKGFGFWNIGTLANGTTGVSDAGLPWIKKFDNSWINESNGKLSIVASKVKENTFYKLMEEYGYLYDISSWSYGDNYQTIKNKLGKIPKVSGLSDNRAVSKPNENGSAVDISKGQQKLNGSNWKLVR